VSSIVRKKGKTKSQKKEKPIPGEKMKVEKGEGEKRRPLLQSLESEQPRKDRGSSLLIGGRGER